MPDITLAWKRHRLVCTGPATFHLIVPIVGSAPDARAAYELVANLQELCRGAVAAEGTRVRAVRGSITTTARGAQLSMYITVAHPSSDPHRDAAYVDGVIRSAVRHTTAPVQDMDTSSLQRMPHADHRSPDLPPPRALHVPSPLGDRVDGFDSATCDERQQLSDADPGLGDGFERPQSVRRNAGRRPPWTSGPC